MVKQKQKYIPVKFHNNEKEIITIIKDAVIFTRIAVKMEDLLSVIDPNDANNSFEPEKDYSGFTVAMNLMGYKSKGYSELEDIFHTIAFKETETKTDVYLAAENIYYQWVHTAMMNKN